MNSMNQSDKKHLEWIYGRLQYVHGEDPNVDYMRRFKQIIDKINDEPCDNEPFCFTREHNDRLTENKERIDNIELQLKNHLRILKDLTKQFFTCELCRHSKNGQPVFEQSPCKYCDPVTHNQWEFKS